MNSTSIRLCARILSIVLSLLLALPAQAQTVLNLPVPGAMLSTTPAYLPTTLKGIQVDLDNPLRFDFLVDRGDDLLEGAAFDQESTKLIKYFLSALTIPENQMWVNLSPYEQNRIIADGFGQTEMGRDLLAQDYMLKQLSSSLMYPENELGKKFWQRVYAQAQEKYGTTEVPTNTINKIWITPQSASIYEHAKGAYIVDSKLKVMLEEDYLATSHQPLANSNKLKAMSYSLSANIMKEILIPEIEREVNEGAMFANLRQIYNAMLLATWYKGKLKDSLLGKAYVDQAKVDGVRVDDPSVNQKIYDQYVAAFNKGVYDYIKEDDVDGQVTPRKYFAGGYAYQAPENQRPDRSALAHEVNERAQATAEVSVDLAMAHASRPLDATQKQAGDASSDDAMTASGQSDLTNLLGEYKDDAVMDRVDEITAALKSLEIKIGFVSTTIYRSVSIQEVSQGRDVGWNETMMGSENSIKIEVLPGTTVQRFIDAFNGNMSRTERTVLGERHLIESLELNSKASGHTHDYNPRNLRLKNGVAGVTYTSLDGKVFTAIAKEDPNIPGRGALVVESKSTDKLNITATNPASPAMESNSDEAMTVRDQLEAIMNPYQPYGMSWEIKERGLRVDYRGYKFGEYIDITLIDSGTGNQLSVKPSPHTRLIRKFGEQVFDLVDGHKISDEGLNIIAKMLEGAAKEFQEYELQETRTEVKKNLHQVINEELDAVWGGELADTDRAMAGEDAKRADMGLPQLAQTTQMTDGEIKKWIADNEFNFGDNKLLPPNANNRIVMDFSTQEQISGDVVNGFLNGKNIYLLNFTETTSEGVAEVINKRLGQLIIYKDGETAVFATLVMFDAAMVNVAPEKTPTGGVDLNPAMGVVDIQSDAGTPFMMSSFTPEMLDAAMKSGGFIPNIIRVNMHMSVPQLFMLLGFNTEEIDRQLASLT